VAERDDTKEQLYVPLLIRERRDRRGWSQGELADQVGVTRNTINRWERGWNPPTLPQRRKLSEVLGGTVDEYEWAEADFERRDRLTQAMIEVRALTRRLMAGEL
jgi:transcriptional regulator with XRE-family HTH domain